MQLLNDYELCVVSGGDPSYDADKEEESSQSSGSSTSSSGSYYGNGTSANCATAECAAGLLPARSENRTQAQIDQSLCVTTITLVAAPVIALANWAGGGNPLTGAAAQQAGRMVGRAICSK
jgi:hypothetical protein